MADADVGRHSPRFFTPRHFSSQAAGSSRGEAVGAKRAASQMTDDEHNDRVRKILSLVKVLLTAKKIKEDSTPAEVLPGVYLGSVGAAHDKSALDAAGITHVLTVAGGFPPKFPDDYVYCVVDVADAPSEGEALRAHFDTCLKFIARALLDGGRVLVHCFAGRSRSTTIVAAYAMATEGTTLKDTMARIHDARPCAAPNEGFMRQLRLFEVELGEARKEGRLLGRIQVDAARCRDALAEAAVDAAAAGESDTSSVDDDASQSEESGAGEGEGEAAAVGAAAREERRGEEGGGP